MKSSPLKKIQDKITRYLANQQTPNDTDTYQFQLFSAYQEIQTTDYLPVNPINALKPFLSKDATAQFHKLNSEQQLLKHSLLSLIQTPEIKITPKTITTALDSKNLKTYPLTIIAILFIFRNQLNIETVLDSILKKVSNIDENKLSPIFWDYFVILAFFHSQHQKLSKKSRHTLFKTYLSKAKQYHIDNNLHFDHETVYSAIENNIIGLHDTAVKNCIQAKAQTSKYALPLHPINLFYSAEHIISVISETQKRPSFEISKHPDKQRCIITSCDQVYFDKYIDLFLSKSTINAVHVHLHCINFCPDNSLIEILEHKYCTSISLTCERYEASKLGDAFGTWCATSRFWILAAILKHYDQCIVSDIDGFIDTLQIPENLEAGIYTFTPNNDEAIRLPWNNVYAGNMIFVRDNKITEIVEKIACFAYNQLANEINLLPRVHYFDQTMLLSICQAYSVTIQHINMFFNQKPIINFALEKSRL